jgi:hypothetical protein
MRAIHRFIAVGSILLAAACSSSDSTPSGPNTTLNGTWQGTVSGATLRVTLHENNHAVTGNGTVSIPGVGSAPVTVTGTVTDPDFDLLVDAGDAGSVEAVGTISADGTHLNGTATMGESSEEFTMTRQ